MIPMSLALANLAPQSMPIGPLSVAMFGALAGPGGVICLAGGLAIALTLWGIAARGDGARPFVRGGAPPRSLRDVAPLPPAA